MGFTTAKTPLFLQQKLAEEIRTLAGDMLFMNPETGERKEKLSVYEQSLPIPTKKETEEEFSGIEYRSEEEEDPVRKCPWCTVKIDSGTVAEINGKQHVTMAIQFAIYDNATENMGHRDVMNLVFMLYQRFGVDPVLDNQYTFTGKFDWALGDENIWPYFTGAAVMEFEFSGFRRESKYT